MISFNNANVLVVGDVMLDEYFHGITNRISPEAPVPIVRVQDKENRVGGAGNVAHNIATLGAKVSIIGIIGEDKEGETIKNTLSNYDIKCCFQVEPKMKTITKVRIMSQHQQLLRLDFEDKKLPTTLDIHQYQQQLKNVNCVVFSDYAKGVLDDIQELIKLAKQQNIPIVIDPKGCDFEKYKGATLLTPNLSEFKAVVGDCDDEKTLVKKGLKLIEDYQLSALLITRSEEGMSLLKSNGDVLHLPTHAQDVYDVTGAGDTVVAALATAVASGKSLEFATRVANIAAGIVVAKVGTATVNLQELNSETQIKTKIFSQKDLQKIVLDKQELGEKIVFTNGCFDLIHPGHIKYLAQAKSLGDKLIVAVNDDTSVKILKGESRPINPLQSRMEVLEGLASIDYLISFSDETPESLICALKPDVLVKGGDYKVENIAGFDCVKNTGGEVITVDFIDGYSSSKIIDKLQQPSK
ncbi:ADP-heptose synthase / D-glycero-beta-D-manno-heptose 7-phosphate kinase [hydrothermal vent metagenome]|uniref:D-glycero-beta-D-manno-heptose 1-phosphate adenylyltransferase n=1 Tax=hydrothermal vent metagenome TaxID=652676 RepID=A0A1W1BN98_9ZZZZ